MKQQIILFMKKTGNILVKNAPHIFTGLAVGGVVGTIALAIKAQRDADDIYDEAVQEHIEHYELELSKDEAAEYNPFTFKQRIQMTWKCYIPTALSAATTIGFIIASDTVNTKRLTAISALYAASQKTIEEYKTAAKEVVGERTSEKVRDKMAENTLQKNPVENSAIADTGHGHTLCYDSLTARYFWSDIDFIKEMKNEFNARLLIDNQMSLNEWYDYLNLDSCGLGDYVGYQCNDLMKLSFSSRLASNSTPCLVINYENEPKLTYRDW